MAIWLHAMFLVLLVNGGRERSRASTPALLFVLLVADVPGRPLALPQLARFFAMRASTGVMRRSIRWAESGGCPDCGAWASRASQSRRSGANIDLGKEPN